MLYVVDLETAPQPDHSMRAWLFDACAVSTLEHFTFVSIVDFMTWLEDEAPEAIYFHNLKHDGPYLMYYLNDNGYRFTDRKEDPEPYEYKMLVTDRNIWFMGAIGWPSGAVTEIRDSLKKIPLSVAKIPEAYSLPIEKPFLDVDRERIGYYIPTPDEVYRCQMDTEIVARALQIHFEQGMNKLTAPADAMAEYKRTINFNRYFVPQFYRTHRDIERFCRKAYWGGLSWVNPAIEGMTVYDGDVYDYNSMYPSVMLFYPYPVGLPVKFFGNPPDDRPLFIARCIVHVERRPGCAAMIRDTITREWVDMFDGEMIMTSIDIDTAARCYYGTIEVLDGYAWRGVQGIFDDYISHWRAVKETSTGGKRQVAKLMQNSLYGKFGMNPDRRHKIPYFDHEGLLRWAVGELEEGQCINVTVSAFITAYSRKELIMGMEKSGNFAYCDTDSVHIFSTKDQPAYFHGKVHKTEYGHWKHEYSFRRAKYLRQKTYIEEEEDGTLHIAACGCPDAAKEHITFDNFELGARYEGKLRMVMRVGGVQLVPSYFTVRAPMDRF